MTLKDIKAVLWASKTFMGPTSTSSVLNGEVGPGWHDREV